MKLKDLAYYRTGGRCQALYEPRTTQDLARIVVALAATQQPYFVLGGGTNSLVLDEDWPGSVIIFSRMKSITVEGTTVTCQAGAENSDVVRTAGTASLSGLEWMYRLPGQIGGTVRMNARCYGGEISQVVKNVTAVLPNGDIREYSPQDGIFKGYKDTLFMQNGAIISEVRIQLEDGYKDDIETKMKRYERDRIEKGQFLHPTCGCVFKNNYTVGIPSGMLLERAGVERLNTQSVSINPKHANFVYNKGASSREILEMTLKMRELVFEEFGVWLEYEMEVLGQLPSDLRASMEHKKETHPRESKLAPLRAEFQSRSARPQSAPE